MTSSLRPEQVDLVGLELPVNGEDFQLLKLGLRDEKAVEGIRMMKRQAAGVQRMAVLNGQRRGAARSIRKSTYSTGGTGRGSFPSAYWIAISQELAAERKIWSPGSWSSARACWDNRCGLACIHSQQ